MTKIVENKETPTDYYTASLEDGSLMIKPYCACGNSLNEDYFCEKCQKKCHCRLILCDDVETLHLVDHYIRNSPHFSKFKAKVAGENETPFHVR